MDPISIASLVLPVMITLRHPQTRRQCRGRRCPEARCHHSATTCTNHLCGKVRARAMGQESTNQSISLTGHPADNSIQSGMSDVSQSVDCLGSVYFRVNSLTHTDDYLSVYDYKHCDYNDAAHEIVDTVFATRTPPANPNKLKKRQGAITTSAGQTRYCIQCQGVMSGVCRPEQAIL